MSEEHKPLLIVDFSCFVHTCWWPAVSAEESQAKHRSKCGDELCRVGENPCEDCPPLYDARKVFLNNLDGKLRTIQASLDERGIRDYEIVFVEDRRSARKYILYPEYKAGRKNEMPVDIPAVAKTHLKNQGYLNWCWSPDNEADDAIATLCNQQPVGRITVIATSDKDLWQLMEGADTGVFIYRLTLGKFVTIADVEKEFGISNPQQIPLCKALWGDSGDNIPNVVPRMQKQLRPLIEQSDGSLYSFQCAVGNAHHGLTDRCKKLLLEGFPAVQRNMELVKLDDSCILEWEKENV